MSNKKLWDNLPTPQKYKKWLNETPYSWCKICSWNAKAWRIKLSNKFPSWHNAPPAHPNCDCKLAFITSTVKLDNNKVWDKLIDTLILRERWNIAIKRALELFKSKGKYYQTKGEWQQKIWINALIWNNNYDPASLYFFKQEISTWESNVKINDEFLELSHNKPWTKYEGKEIWWEVNIKGQTIYLADIWNLLFWYLWARMWITNPFLENAANFATAPKALYTWDTVENNEKDDRIFYKLWYELAEKYTNEELTEEILTEYLIKWTNEANKIRQNKTRPNRLNSFWSSLTNE